MDCKKRTAVFSAVVLLVVAALVSAACGKARQPRETTSPTVLKVGRLVGYCNFPLFVAAHRKLALRSGVDVRLVYIPNPADHPAALSAGRIDATVAPFTNLIAAFGSGRDIRIIAGSGMNGLALVGRPNIRTLSDLRGKRIGTVRGDTLELMAYDAIKKAGLRGLVTFEFFTDGFEALQAVRSGRYDAVTHVEPFVSRLVHEDGMHVLATGEKVWGTDHPDCVLATSPQALARHRSALKGLILAMLAAEHETRLNLSGLADELARSYYQMEPDALVQAVRVQYPRIDIRPFRNFILMRAASMREMGYLRRSVDDSVFDFSLLEEALRENPDIAERVSK
jgi:NitT/TauT family transport system substrate-binding protein